MKKWYSSKTIQIAIIQAVLGTLIIVMESGAAWEVGLVLILKSVVDVYVRFTTTDPIVVIQK